MPHEFVEELKVSGKDIVETVKRLVKEGNARKLIIKNEKGESVMEIPLMVGAVGTLLLPTIAALGAIAALVSECTIVIVRRPDPTP